MYFPKILSATLFAALAIAAPAPAPQTVSVDSAQIQAFSQNLQAICANIDANLSGANSEFNNLLAGWQGNSAESFQQLWSQVSNSNGQLQQACASIVGGLSDVAKTYQQSESDNAETLTGALAGLG
ncbi:hypothetical protein BJX64DRAFT_269740 [Aspergillus heterothallicus]